MVEGNVIKKEHIVAEYEHDKRNFNIKLCPKLTERHIHPNTWDKMNVARAIQVFSNTVSAAIQTLVVNSVLNEEAVVTADFIKKINDIFDELNVKNMYSRNPHGQPIKRGYSLKINRIKNALEFFNQIQVNSQVKCVLGLK